MSYVDDYNTAESENFQKGCYVATWLVAQDILSDAQASAERKDWAQKVMEDRTSITLRQLSFQMMRHAPLKAAGGAASDAVFLEAALVRLDDLVRIG